MDTAMPVAARGSLLHVVTDTNRRGAQVFATDLAAQLERCGLPGTVVAIRPGATGAQLGLSTLGRGPRHLPTLLALRRAMRDASVVVAHGSNTLMASVLAGVGLKTPIVYRNISDPAYWVNTRLRRARVTKMLSRVDQVVALWQGGADYLRTSLRVPHDKVTVIPNAVRAADFRAPEPRERRLARERFGLPPQATVLLFPAALQPEKHPETAVRALGALPSSTWLLVVGDGPRRAEVTRLAERVTPGRVVLAGQISHMLEAYWASDLVVLPSEGEGLPAVLIEAGLCQLPAVASSSGGNADIVIDGMSGRIVPPADDVRLAAAVTDVIAHRARYGAEAAAHCLATFEMGRVAEQWASVLSGVGAVTELAGRR